MGVLAVLVIAGAWLVVASFRTPRPVVVDTRLASGLHLKLVLIAPTGLPPMELAASVSAARDSLRAVAERHGLYYSTIGVSDNWSLERGGEILEAFGAFDEVIIGRNWLNTGIETFVSRLGATAGVPQVVVLLQHITVDSLPYRYGHAQEVLRLVGSQPIEDWAKRGSPVNLSTVVPEDPELGERR
jgi:hypothetical protein